MIEQLRRWLVPRTVDEDQARRQHILNIILLGALVFAIPTTLFSIIGWLIGPIFSAIADVLVSGGSTIILALAYTLSLWGRLRASSVLLVGLAVLLPTAYIVISRDVHDPVLSIYFVAVVIAGLLLGARGSTIVAVIISVLYIGLAWYTHLTVGQILQPLSWLVVDGAAGLIALSVWLYVRETGQVMQHLRRQTQELQMAHQEKSQLVEDLQALTAQQRELLDLVGELTTPVIPVQEGVIVLPLVGHVDADRARLMITSLLEGITAHRARVVVIDVTGVPMMDSMLAQSLLQMAQGARLLGATCVLSGLRAEVAHTLSRLDVNLGMLVTSADLQSGIEYAQRQIGERET